MTPIDQPSPRASMTTDREPTPAGGADTLIGVIEAAGEQGYTTQQISRPDGRIECVGCGNQSEPATFDIQHLRRLEGASDPADLLLVLWSACPACERRGVLTLGYGPAASDGDVAILQQLDLADADPDPTH